MEFIINYNLDKYIAEELQKHENHNLILRTQNNGDKLGDTLILSCKDCREIIGLLMVEDE